MWIMLGRSFFGSGLAQVLREGWRDRMFLEFWRVKPMMEIMLGRSCSGLAWLRC